MATPRKEQIARNESVFRNLNERLEENVERRRSDADLAGFLCECGDADCEAIVRLDLATYEEIRRDPLQFFVVAGHEMADAEDIVAEAAGHLVVRKHKDVADIAVDGDARSRG